MKKNLGFTLIELMIVVAIIAIIAAIAIPSLLRSRMSANEAGAIGSLRTISAGEVSFQAACYQDANGDGTGDYGTLAQLLSPDAVAGVPGYIDEVLAAGVKHGYNFVLNTVAGGAAAPATYTCNADPQSPQSGRRTFFLDESGVIRFENTGAAATAASTPLG
ncbi:MAG TPA: prepilin-type N-terminal cleavage/methylation domain-containing protein [Candidatus Hydrogenedentes bacterium]|nr:prepilin-type N-terminal cleavage/methylation domain-containing protein [Candidatus Hydrogenedentota bacterium]HQH53080.1 prepilin-type N-terminal cleavage/methylation domain-containing protein [Candidatus Hydrogenedentota bacterium]